MKQSSGQHQEISPVKARNAALMNQLATPGLGSLMARRWVAGTGQLVLALAGFFLLMYWAVRLMMEYYGQIMGPVVVTPIAWAGWWGGACFSVSWIWSGITSVQLLRSATQRKKQSLEEYAANLVKLDEAGVMARMTLLPGWKRRDAAIVRVYEFKDFPAAMKFVNAVANVAEQAWHHPDIDIRWNKVSLSLTTHDVGGLSAQDFDLAHKVDDLIPKLK